MLHSFYASLLEESGRLAPNDWEAGPETPAPFVNLTRVEFMPVLYFAYFCVTLSP
jgi:hypothetical protein